MMRRFLIIVLLFLAGCKVGPDYEPPVVSIPEKWENAPLDSQTLSKLSAEASWWDNYKDPILTYLIKRTIKSNYEIKIASAKIMQSEAILLESHSEFAPKFTSKGFFSRDKFNPSFSVPVTPLGTEFNLGRKQYLNFSRIDFSVNWEVDLFGRLRRGIESAEATVEAEIEDMRGVLLSLITEVASNYITLRSYQDQLRIKEKSLETWNSIYTLNQTLLKAGLTTNIDIENIKSAKEQAESSLNGLRANIKKAIHQLSILVGEKPAYLYALLSKPKPIPVIPSKIFAGLPSELLKRRPDIQAAERRLAAATAEIGVSEGKLFPSFSLTGTLHKGLLDANSFKFRDSLYIFSSGFSWPIFNFSHIEAQINLSVAVRDENLYQYKNILLKAFAEVENALVNYAYESKNYKDLKSSYEANKVATDLSSIRYKAGLTSFIDFLKADLICQDSEMALVQSQMNLALDSVMLYKVLAGGVEK